MHRLNALDYPGADDLQVSRSLSIETLDTNDEYETLSKELTSSFGLSSLHTFSFSKEGFLGLMLELKSDIAVSLGESEAVIKAAELYGSLGFKVTYIGLLPDGSIDYDSIGSLKAKYLFLSSYIIDTYVKVDLKMIRKEFSGTIISNISATLDVSDCDVAYFDVYRLSGYSTHSVLLHNSLFEEQYIANIDTLGVRLISEALSKERALITCKEEFIKVLSETLKDDLIFFVDPGSTLGNVVHFGLKGIKAREVIRNLSLSNIFVTNGEGCSLGLSRPSRTIQVMGHTESQSRQALSLSFHKDLSSDEIRYVVSKLSRSYRQIKALHE